MNPNFAAIPDELKGCPRWVVWKGAQKVPYCPVLGAAMPASSVDAKTWGTYTEAEERYKRGGFAGVGFVLADPYCGVDLDHCLDEGGECYPKARAVVEALNSYTEVSPSGKGLKIIVRGRKPGGRCKKPAQWANGIAGRVEMYDVARYFTVTGRIIPDTPLVVAERQAEVAALYHQLFPVVAPAKAVPANAERCWAYLLKCPDSISGQGGHDKCLRAACECMRFDLTDDEAAALMRRWSAEKSGDEPWSESQIAHKIENARAKCAGEIGVRLKEREREMVVPVAHPDPAPSSFSTRLERIISGEFAAAPWKWDAVSELTQALLPGAVTLLCGDPGAGKTFFVLDAALGWLELGVPFALFELEEDRDYYLQRALAILEGCAELTDLKWVRANPDKARAAKVKHASITDALARAIHDAPKRRVPLMELADWYEEVSGTARVVVIDPVTAASTGRDRWVEDGAFVERCKTIALESETSLVLVTHPKLGKRMGAPTMDDLAGGADFPRFSQTVLVLAARKNGADPLRVVHRTPFGTKAEDVMANRVLHLRKTRNGRGGGRDIAFNFDTKTLNWHELGVVANG